MVNASIVLYHNNLDQLKKAIHSALNSSLLNTLYLIDNSRTNELQVLAEIDHRIEYIFNNANLGYGKAHNIALKKSIELNIPYHLVLNPDVYFGEGVIEEIYEYMEANSSVGQVMPQVLYPNGDVQYLCKLLPSPVDLIFRRFFPFKKSKEKRNDKYELRFTGYNQIMDVPYLSGCFMFLRTESLIKVGLFDERFFMYPEDIDLTRRMHRYCRTVFFPNVLIYHEHQKSSFKSFKMLRIHALNIIKYFNKWGWFWDPIRTQINQETLNQFVR